MFRSIGFVLAWALAMIAFVPSLVSAEPEKPQASPLAALRAALPDISAAVDKALAAEPESEPLKAASAAVARLAKAMDATFQPDSAEAIRAALKSLEATRAAREAEAQRRVAVAQAMRDSANLAKGGQKTKASERLQEALALDPGNEIVLKRISVLDPAAYERLPAEAKAVRARTGSFLDEESPAGDRRGDLRRKADRLAEEGKHEEALAEIVRYDAAEPPYDGKEGFVHGLRAKIGMEWIGKELPEADRLVRAAAETRREPELSGRAARLAEIATAWEERNAPAIDSAKRLERRDKEEQLAIARLLRNADAAAKAGRYADSAEMLRQILAADPENAIVKSRLKIVEDLSRQERL